jgi:hypothetical protein
MRAGLVGPWVRAVVVELPLPPRTHYLVQRVSHQREWARLIDMRPVSAVERLAEIAPGESM